MLGRTDSRLSSITRSPWDPALTPGGSSGGASASVAAGVTPLAIGTDMGGSTRLPASYTGLVGMRPSTGRIPGGSGSGHLYRFPGDRAIRPDDARYAAAVRCPGRTGPARSVLPTVAARAGSWSRPSYADRLVHRDRRRGGDAGGRFHGRRRVATPGRIVRWRRWPHRSISALCARFMPR